MVTTSHASGLEKTLFKGREVSVEGPTGMGYPSPRLGVPSTRLFMWSEECKVLSTVIKVKEKVLQYTCTNIRNTEQVWGPQYVPRLLS